MKKFVNYFKTPAKNPSRKVNEKKEAEKLHPKFAFKNKLIIVKTAKYTKFKLRTGRMLITHKAESEKNAKAILSHVPPTLQKEEVNKKADKKKTKKN